MEFKTLDDILDFAISKEQEAEEFYLNLCEEETLSGNRQTFQDFAKEEQIIQERNKLYQGIKDRIASVRDTVVEASAKGEESEKKLTAALQEQSDTAAKLKETLRSMDEEREAMLNKSIERGQKQLEAERELATDSMDLLNERIALE